ncbi:TraB/GumN family protein [Bacteroidota bacterium]
MKKRKIRIPTLIAIFVCLIAIFIAKSSDEPSDCFIWKVKINKSIFYLAGSIHTASKENYPLPKVYMKSYRKADKVIFEIEDDFLTLEKKIFQYAEKDRLKEDQFLNHHLSTESIKKLKQIIEVKKLNKYFQYEAWLLNMIIAGYRSKLIGYDPLFSIDKYFHELAEKDKKEIIGLDSIKTQLLLFDFEAPFENQVKIIEKAVDEMEIMAKNEIPLYKAYFENNHEQFEKEFLNPFDFNKPHMKQMYDLVCTNRNTKWVEQFEILSNEKPGKYFVIVGSGHYFGPNNIRVLLEQKGYKIEKI